MGGDVSCPSKATLVSPDPVAQNVASLWVSSVMTRSLGWPLTQPTVSLMKKDPGCRQAHWESVRRSGNQASSPAKEGGLGQTVLTAFGGSHPANAWSGTPASRPQDSPLLKRPSLWQPQDLI